MYDGEPQWTEIRFELDEDEFPNVGILHFNGKEKIFPVDGQHRVEGIKEAVKKKGTEINDAECEKLLKVIDTSKAKIEKQESVTERLSTAQTIFSTAIPRLLPRLKRMILLI